MFGHEPLAADRLLADIVGDTAGDDEQLRALHRAIKAALEIPLDVFVVGEPLVLIELDYDGNARRGLVARCRRQDGAEYRVGFADVEIRARTPGASYLAAYHAWLGFGPDATPSAAAPRGLPAHKATHDDLDLSNPIELVVLAITERAARCRLLGGQRALTLRARSLHRVVAGQIVTVQPNKHWRHGGHPYLSGQIVSTRIDASLLGLVPLALRAMGRPDADDQGRPAFELEMPVIAADWFDQDGTDAELAAKRLELDLRFLDAHARLGDGLVRMSPPWALQHYEVGVRIAELTVGESFDGILPWRLLGNRPLLSCLSGYGSCLWRLGRWDDAERVLARVLRLDPADAQDVGSSLVAIRARRPWSDDEVWP